MYDSDILVQRDKIFGLRAELNEANFQLRKAESANSELRRIIARQDAEITAIRLSHTWRIGSIILTPIRWMKRSKR